MQKLLPTLLSLFMFVSFLNAQDKEVSDTQSPAKILKGRIIDVNDKTALQSANIVNLNTAVGTITNSNGNFEIPAHANDTLHISYLGYQSIKLKITNDLLRGNELEIAIHEKTIDIDEVTVKAHNLIGVLEIDAKNVPMDKFSRIHIEGLPQTYEIGKPQGKEYTGVGGALFNPVDFWYTKFGKKPKELKKLRKLKEQDNSRDMMEGNFSREILMDYMDMSRKELDDLLKECNYSSSFTKKASDLQIIEAVLECYENYRAIKEGTVSKEKVRVNNQEKN
ncbi:carboxypeptidase-like regulatory domain-containing protein [Aureibaculum algae]|uniref:Carboxypeptidase-like regulatory domain-containing protein n=1 Tax=Aureibaculum algae TaxID=2584122 RepID=A0A5B7TV84_9FLAO|nr:carboxypeptidase-like regulatory domain-containing protein [Aureibaculum algae]QCX39203.1 carboxypeptidase-like regulatory domain-containing protein [Aureibaculum algae]